MKHSLNENFVLFGASRRLCGDWCHKGTTKCRLIQVDPLSACVTPAAASPLLVSRACVEARKGFQGTPPICVKFQQKFMCVVLTWNLRGSSSLRHRDDVMLPVRCHVMDCRQTVNPAKWVCFVPDLAVITEHIFRYFFGGATYNLQQNDGYRHLCLWPRGRWCAYK